MAAKKLISEKIGFGISDQAFFEAIAAVDDLGVVVRGSIHVEHELIAWIEERVAAPTLLPPMEYSQRVDIALALGLRSNLGSALRSLGSIRNGFAHEPDAAIGKQEAKNLFAALSPREKTALRDSVVRISESAPDKYEPQLSKLSADNQVRMMIVVLRQAVRAARMLAAEGLPH